MVKKNNESITISGNLVQPINIRDLMYDTYLNYQSNIYPPQIDPITIFQIHMSNIISLFILLQQTKVPTVIGFLDWNIQDYYMNIFSIAYANPYYPILITSQLSPTLDDMPNTYINFERIYIY